MSGLFDYFSKKKKEEKQKSLFEMIVPPLPVSKPPAEIRKEKAVSDYFKPKSNLPAKTEPKKSFLPSVDFLIPKEKKAEKPLSIVPEVNLPKAEKPRKSVEEGIKEVFQSPPRPLAPAPAPAPASKRPSKYVFLRPSAPPERIPYGLPAPAAQRPVMEWTMPTPSQLAQHFRGLNLQSFWDRIRQIRAMPEFQADQIEYYKSGVPMMIPIYPVVYQERFTDFANFYGIPWDVMASYLNVPPEQEKAAEEALWNNVLSPLNAMVPEAFEILKPPDLPGFFNVSFRDPTGEYYLNYIEPMFEEQLPPGGFSGP